mmetsp:Transcript_87432/g.270707  ORF Transcript_87432/g.270707 Transcript_87432/m.270707 type:complete len:306 (+) Transcript_87432:198-1115(+)
MDVEPQRALPLDVLGDAGVPAVLDGREVLLRAHPVDVRHGGDEAEELLQGGEHKLQSEHLLVHLRAAVLLVRLHKACQVAVQVLGEDVMISAVEPWPQFVAQPLCAHVAPVKDAQIQLTLLITPEVRIVNVQVVVGKGYVLLIGVAIPNRLGGVGIQGHHHLLGLRLKGLGLHVAREQRLRRVPNEIPCHLKLLLENLRRLPCAAHVHAPTLNRPAGPILKVLAQHFDVTQLPSLVQPGHLGPRPDEAVIILRGVPSERPVDALVVRPLALVRLQWFALPLLGSTKVQRVYTVSEGNPLDDQDEV